MIPFYPLIRGPVILAEDRAMAERIGRARNPDNFVRCQSRLEMELERDEASVPPHRRAVHADDDG
jgi:hypothetical protein